MSDVIIVGNGKSRLKFNFPKIKKERNCPLFACNLGYIDLPYDKLFAIDEQIIRELIEKNISFIDVPDSMKWEPAEVNIHRPRNNTGMVAMQWAIFEGYRNLHLYGFDFVLDTPEEKMSNVFAGHHLYGPETACSFADSFNRLKYLKWMQDKNPDVNFTFYFDL
jgi:hypothetical protein